MLRLIDAPDGVTVSEQRHIVASVITADERGQAIMGRDRRGERCQP